MKTIAIIAIVLALGLCAAVTADPAGAHVRDRDKVALCNGDRDERRHFHDAGIELGYYYHIQFDYRSGNYVHYDVWKTGYLAGPYDRANKAVNCLYW